MLRKITSADIDAVLRLAQQVHSHPWTRGNFSDAIASGYQCLLAEVEGEIVGYAVLMLAVEDAELLDIGVASTEQRQGIGRALLYEMRERAQGKARLLLEVRVSNLVARQFYQSLGWTEIGRRRDYYLTATAREDAILMEWRY